MLIDEITITVKAGNGGNGASTFLRNRHQPKGGPDGGEGGIGGSIFFQGTTDITALTQFAYKKHIQGEDGEAGRNQNKHGKNGKDKIILIPVGTTVVDKTYDHTYEITNTEDKILIAAGARGGHGNAYYKSAIHQSPTHSEPGRQTPVKEIYLKLAFIADVGLIGLPNAGKSTLLAELTAATPKIGDYPFTTLEPNLGVFGKLVLADIPGLIEGASEGKGLGIKFLKHIEKTKILVHCIDISTPDILHAYNTVRAELKAYNPLLLKKKEIIILTKFDMVDEETAKLKKSIFTKKRKKVLLISIIDEKSLEELKKTLVIYVR